MPSLPSTGHNSSVTPPVREATVTHCHNCCLFSENDLEEILTRYTRINNNASIFLGNSPSRPATSQWKASKPTLQRQTETRKHLRRYDFPNSKESWRLLEAYFPCKPSTCVSVCNSVKIIRANGL